MKTPNKKPKKTIQKKTGQKMTKAKAKTKVQIKIKKTAPRIKKKPQVKTKAQLATKVKSNIQIETKKIVQKSKPKTQAKAKKVMLKSDAIINETTRKAPEEIVPQNEDSMKSAHSTDVQPRSVVKNEEYTNEKQLAHFRAVLLQCKEQLMEDVGHVTLHLQKDASNHADPIDCAAKEEELSVEVHSQDRKLKLLKKIEEALVRFNSHDYGYCVDCGAEIGIARLEVQPTATQCIECRTIAETKEKQIGEDAVTRDAIQD